MQKLEALKEEGQRFLEDTGYGKLDDLAMINANTYMRGLKEGMRLAQAAGADKQPEPVTV